MEYLANLAVALVVCAIIRTLVDEVDAIDAARMECLHGENF